LPVSSAWQLRVTASSTVICAIVAPFGRLNDED
jgi:hypothetical protein